MKLTFDEKLAINYKSASQKMRVLTEQWVDNSIFCPNCGHLDIDKYPNNQPVKDKIRQQLQVLRDKGYLDFVSRGYYCLA